MEWVRHNILIILFKFDWVNIIKRRVLFRLFVHKLRGNLSGKTIKMIRNRFFVIIFFVVNIQNNISWPFSTWLVTEIFEMFPQLFRIMFSTLSFFLLNPTPQGSLALRASIFCTVLKRFLINGAPSHPCPRAPSSKVTPLWDFQCNNNTLH